jgi:RND superfamily putative drug exporter
MVLMPAFMHVLGAGNWWAPEWLTRLHRRFGLHETTDPATDLPLEKERVS